MIAYAAPLPGFKAGSLEPHPEDDAKVLIRKPNGKVVSVSPTGAVEERDVAGAWESFERKGHALLAERGDKMYVLLLVAD
jgi:hypothetical protein